MSSSNTAPVGRMVEKSNRACQQAMLAHATWLAKQDPEELRKASEERKNKVCIEWLKVSDTEDIAIIHRKDGTQRIVRVSCVEAQPKSITPDQ